MEPNRFLFRLTAIFLQYFLLIAIFLPLIYLSQLVKYQFNPDEIYFLKVLFLAIAIAMPFAVGNAFAFANYENIDLTYYLKSNQKLKVILQKNREEIMDTLKANLTQKPFWKISEQKADSISYAVKSLILTDKVTVELKKIDETKTELLLTSHPFISFIFLDFGRNYRNILTVLMATK